MGATIAESADDSLPSERYSAAIDRELEKMRAAAATRGARYASFRVRPPEAERMTEAEWLASHDPDRMLREVGPAASTRTLRLVMCQCCRRVWEGILGPYRVVVEVAEKYLMGEATADEFESAAGDARMAWFLHSPSNECSDVEVAAAQPLPPGPARRRDQVRPSRPRLAPCTALVRGRRAGVAPPLHLRQPVSPHDGRPAVAVGNRPRPRRRHRRRPCVRPDANPGGCPPGGRVRGRAASRPLPGFRHARSWLLGTRLGVGRRVGSGRTWRSSRRRAAHRVSGVRSSLGPRRC